MAKIFGGSYTNDVRSILGAIRSLPAGSKMPAQPDLAPPPPFITIKREAGAGGHSVATLLVERLNAINPSPRPWSGWDKELVEKVSGDLDVSQKLVDAMEHRSRNWLNDVLSGIQVSDGSEVDDFKIYRQTANSIRALAHIGRVVIVGRGSTYITANMPGGIHVHLVAPHEYRVRHMGELLGISKSDAEAEVLRLEKNRNAFLKRYWPTQYQRTDLFHLVINMGLVTEQQAANAIAQLVC